MFSLLFRREKRYALPPRQSKSPIGRTLRQTVGLSHRGDDRAMTWAGPINMLKCFLVLEPSRVPLPVFLFLPEPVLLFLSAFSFFSFRFSVYFPFFFCFFFVSFLCFKFIFLFFKEFMF